MYCVQNFLFHERCSSSFVIQSVFVPSLGLFKYTSLFFCFNLHIFLLYTCSQPLFLILYLLVFIFSIFLTRIFTYTDPLKSYLLLSSFLRCLHFFRFVRPFTCSSALFLSSDIVSYIYMVTYL